MNKTCYTGEVIKSIGAARHDDHMIKMMHQINLMATGTNFFLAMRDKYGSIGLYPRVNQPCMGEFRKYKDHNPNDPHAKPHGDLAHGDKAKPLDLYSPFPSGEPVAFGKVFYLTTSSGHNDLFRYAFSNKSPWRDAFGDESFVEFTKEKDVIKGVVIKTTDIDPSVFIQLSWVLSASYRVSPIWEQYKSLGFDEREALLISVIENGYSMYTPIQSFNIKRFLTQNPYHLLPMTFRNGADYARSHGRGTVGAEGCWQDRTNKIGFNYDTFSESLKPFQEEIVSPYGNKILKPLPAEEKAPHWRKVIDEYKDKDDPVEEVIEVKEEKAA